MLAIKTNPGDKAIIPDSRSHSCTSGRSRNIGEDVVSMAFDGESTCEADDSRLSSAVLNTGMLDGVHNSA